MKPLIQRAALLLVAFASAARRSVYVKRASGHSGSRWIAVNLAASNLSTFFQDGGLCAGRCCLHGRSCGGLGARAPTSLLSRDEHESARTR